MQENNIIRWIYSIYYRLKFYPFHLIITTVLLTLLLFLPQTYITWRSYKDFNSIVKDEFRLQTLSDKIIYLDEVLTMSAYMNAATGDHIWQQRYQQFEPQLDAAIKESIKLAPKIYKSDDSRKIDAANQLLVSMENQSFELVQAGQLEAAKALLSSDKYKMQKQYYAAGVIKRNKFISIELNRKLFEYYKYLFWSNFASVISLAMLIPAWFLVVCLLKEYLKANKIAQQALEHANQELEMRVYKRTEELKDKNNELQQMLLELQRTQLQLIQTEKMSSLNRMVAGIAHEINNPVNFIYANLRYVEQYAQDLLHLTQLYQKHLPKPPVEIEDVLVEIDFAFLNKDLTKVLQSMWVGAERIRKIVLSLRNFSRLDEAEMKQVDVHEGLDSTIVFLNKYLKEKSGHTEIEIVKEYGKLTLVECYAGQLNQVFMSILTNAIDALEERNHQLTLEEIKAQPSTIRISTATKEDTIIIKIADNGIGISDVIGSKIFDPFFTTKVVGKGIGLGLAISYQIITCKHSGKLYYKSTPGQGTEFVIELPILQLL
ncbi:two-component sensor histidine kinase [Calothrix sp. HK-06]|nr:two-component sensor histidine kinase [Calothrix sp. HK-06]